MPSFESQVLARANRLCCVRHRVAKCDRRASAREQESALIISVSLPRVTSRSRSRLNAARQSQRSPLAAERSLFNFVRSVFRITISPCSEHYGILKLSCCSSVVFCCSSSAKVAETHETPCFFPGNTEFGSWRPRSRRLRRQPRSPASLAISGLRKKAPQFRGFARGASTKRP